MKRQIILITKKELKYIVRQNSLKVLFGIITILLAFALYAGFTVYQQKIAMIKSAKEEKRTEWLDQGDKHPHIAAHYGTYVFKPKTALSLFDFGLDTYTGTSVYLEAHYPHDFMFRPAQGYGNIIRFGELSAALVFQLLLPLLILFLTFQTFTKEKETGTLKLLFSQGVSLRSIYLGKLLAYVLIITLITAPFFTVLYVLGIVENTNSILNDTSTRIIFLFIIYTGYLGIFSNFSIWVSLKSSNARNALLTLLIFWITTGIIIPKTAANFGETIYPLISKKIHKENIQRDIEDGMQPSESKERRLVDLKDSYLQKYQVDSLHKLPLNFEGIRMQANENYSNKVNDFHNALLYKQFENQNSVGSIMSLIAPYIGVRNLSMAFAATDWYSFNHFEKRTEDYRRYLIKTMNEDMAYNSKYGEFYEYKANRNLWESISDFDYIAPSVNELFPHYWVEFASLLFWGLGGIMLIPSAKYKL